MSERPARNDLSGTVLGPSVQAGTIHGDVHLHEHPGGAGMVPRQLLPAPARFVGRDHELSALDDALAAGMPVLVLTGPGGIGKTALAMRWAHAVRDRFTDGQLHVDLRGWSRDPDGPVDPRVALGSFLRALGVPARAVPIELAEQAALYRTVTSGRSLLIVLDNAYSAAQVRPLVSASASALTVVTTRARLDGLVPDGAVLVDVGPLPAADSMALLTGTVGAARIGREPAVAEDLVTACGGFPIAVCVAAARLARRPRLSIARVAAELADRRRRLAELSTSDGTSIEAVFDVSYSCLDSAVAALYRRLAVHPGPDFGPGVAAAVAVNGTPELAPPADAIGPLLAANLVEEIDEDRFRYHDLVGMHGRSRCRTDDTAPQRTTALLAILEWYVTLARRADTILTPYRRRLPYRPVTRQIDGSGFDGRRTALEWLERERVNLIAAGQAALDHDHAELAWHLADVQWPVFLISKHYADREQVDRCGVEAARRWGNGWAEADMLKRLSRIRAIGGDTASAEALLQLSIDRYREAADPAGHVDARNSLAMLYRDAGRLTDAVEILTRTVDDSRQMRDVRRTGLSQLELGRLMVALGRAGEAVDLLREAGSALRTMRDADPYNSVRADIGLAGALLATGALAPAEEFAAGAAERMRELGSRYEEAEALDLLGRIAVRGGQTGAAKRHWRAASTILEDLGSPRAAALRRSLADLDR